MTELKSHLGTWMMPAVKIKPGQYGKAIGLLLEQGGAFQTQHERILIITAEQKEKLEEANLIDQNGSGAIEPRHGKEKNAG